jgi:hypothetical protein
MSHGWQGKVMAAAATFSALSSAGVRVTAERARSYFPAASAATKASTTTGAFLGPPPASLQQSPARTTATPAAYFSTMYSNPLPNPHQEQVVWPPQRHRSQHHHQHSQAGSSPSSNRKPPTLSTQRLYHSKRTDDSSSEQQQSAVRGLLSKAKNVAQKFLPKKWFQSEEERRRAAELQQVQDQVSGGLRELFKDAPLPLRVLGRAIAPLLSNLLSAAAETAAAQQTTVDAVRQQTLACLNADPAVARALGGGTAVTLGPPVSQASSSSSINGQTRVRVELVMPVTAVGGSSVDNVVLQSPGVVRVVATGDGQSDPSLQLLEVQVQGRVISVSTTPGPQSTSSRFAASSRSDGQGDDIIEAEIVEKKNNRH